MRSDQRQQFEQGKPDADAPAVTCRVTLKRQCLQRIASFEQTIRRAKRAAYGFPISDLSLFLS